MEAKFKFEIGDTVVLRSELERWECEVQLGKEAGTLKSPQGLPPSYSIVARNIDKQLDDVQYHYQVRCYNPVTGRQELIQFNEIELEKISLQEYSKKLLRSFFPPGYYGE